MTEMLVLSWKDFDQAVDVLAAMVSPWHGAIYGVPRGGLPLAVALSHRFGLPLVSQLDTDTLIVDDIIDSGKTLQAFPDACQKIVWVARSGHTANVQAALTLDPGDDRWVLFPWELAIHAATDKADYATRK